MAKFPIFLELNERRAVVIGAGHVAVRKAQSLLDAGARVVVVADKIDQHMSSICKKRNAELIPDKYASHYLNQAVLVIAATNNPKVNRQIYDDCQKLQILCNVVDCPELCDFFVPGVIEQGALTIAVSTGGKCPAYAGHIRKKIDEIITDKHGEFLESLQKARKTVYQKIQNPDQAKKTLGHLVSDKSFDHFIKKGAAEWELMAESVIQNADEL
jgi:precorrin-2 dehydrogenase/sirohydrochlorin ferrochelatase